ncbi:hypothetical protein Ahy_B07g087974 [Arachis hypogaea]|uniref:MADS-box domain-containing protein n=1 Tax=Arachis hypogaea TaxID=3818 RepID=A0A444YDF9_ARAHY|nr:hypothetical protein Ahy_B07g087974 [Arachis hypogaea]
MALSNEQQPQDSNQFLGYIMDGISKMDMQNLIKNNDSLVDRLNAEKERGKTLSRVLKTIKNDNNITNWVIGPYPTLGSMSTFSNIAFTTGVNPFDVTREFGDQNVHVWYPSYQHQQGYNGLFLYNVSNRNDFRGNSGYCDSAGNHPYHSNSKKTMVNAFLAFHATIIHLTMFMATRGIKKLSNHFYKEKNGILKEANKMKSLCDVVVDLIIYSSSGKAYYYGDFLLKAIKMALSNEKQPQGSNQFLGYIMEGMSKMDMQSH